MPKKPSEPVSYPTHQLAIPEKNQPQEISIFDSGNPAAIINLVSPEFASRMREVPEDLLRMSENQFFKKYRPSPVMNNIRLSFWLEAYSAQDQNVKMNMARVYGRFCGKEYFYQELIKNDAFIAWILIPPVQYEVLLEEAVFVGHQRWREILDLEIVDRETGKINNKALDAIIKVTTVLDMRSRGMFTQRSEIRSLNFNVEADGRKMGAQLTQLSMDELDKKLKKLEGVREEELHTQAVIEVKKFDSGNEGEK